MKRPRTQKEWDRHDKITDRIEAVILSLMIVALLVLVYLMMTA